jgi:DNA invertase Pin-like site-specific DNA recombinase
MKHQNKAQKAIKKPRKAAKSPSKAVDGPFAPRKKGVLNVKEDNCEAFGYIRVSTKEQNPDRQRDEMEKLGVPEKNIVIEYASGKSIGDRPAYQALRARLRKGDRLYLDSLDRLGRSLDEIPDEWRLLTKKMGVDVVCLDLPMMDSSKFASAGKLGPVMEDLSLVMLSWCAQEERSNILRRTAQGIALAKLKGKYKGRARKRYDVAMFDSLMKEISEGKAKKSWAAKELGLTRSTFRRREMEWAKEKNMR